MRPETPPDRGTRGRCGGPVVAALATLTAVAGVLLHAALGPPDTFWTIDNGGKALVLDNLLEDAGRTWIDYPGAAIDPDFRFFPQPLGGAEPYATVRQGRVHSQYAAPFVWLSLPFVRAFGFRGLALLPALAAGAAVLLTGATAAARSGARAGRTAAAALALATPLLFYASVFWEHTLVTALAAGALFVLVRRRPGPVVAGLLAGAAGLIREECFLLVIAMTGGLLWSGRRRDAPRFAAGAAAAAALAAVLQKVATGSWTGTHLAVNAPVPFVNAWEATRGLLLHAGAAGLSAWLGASLLAAFAIARGRRLPTLFAAAATVAAAVSLIALARFPAGEDEALALIHSNSALVFLPWALAVPFLAVPRPRGGRDLIPAAILLFVALFVILVPQRSITGVHPGPRMLLPVVPWAAVLLAERFPANRPAAAALVLALLASGAWSARSLRLLADKRHAAGALAAAIAEDPRRIVVTDLFWLPTELSPLWDRKEFHLVNGPVQLGEIARAAAAGGAAELLLVTAPGSVADAPLRTVSDPRFPAFAAELHRHRTAPRETGP